MTLARGMPLLLILKFFRSPERVQTKISPFAESLVLQKDNALQIKRAVQVNEYSLVDEKKFSLLNTTNYELFFFFFALTSGAAVAAGVGVALSSAINSETVTK